MRWLMLVGLIGVSMMTASVAWAQEPGVISPDDLEAARAIERNTYHNEQYGFSITKPEEWVLYTESDRLDKTCCGMWLDDSEAWRWKSTAAVVSRFSFDEQWVLVPPMVVIQIYEAVSPTAVHAVLETPEVVSEGVMRLLLLGLQAKTALQGQIILAPQRVTLGGKEWRTAAYTATIQTPLPDGTKTAVETYNESSTCATPAGFVWINFIARPVDVPSYRKDVDRIIQSITLSEPTPKPTLGARETRQL